MKKLILFSIALICLFGFTGSAKAQLPFPGQTIPTLHHFNSTDYTSGGDHFYAIEIGTTGTPTTGIYYLQIETGLDKQTGSTWGNIEYDVYNDYWPGTMTALASNQTSVGHASIYGSGFYRLFINEFAYNPSSHARIFLWQHWVVFQVP